MVAARKAIEDIGSDAGDDENILGDITDAVTMRAGLDQVREHVKAHPLARELRQAKFAHGQDVAFRLIAGEAGRPAAD